MCVSLSLCKDSNCDKLNSRGYSLRYLSKVTMIF